MLDIQGLEVQLGDTIAFTSSAVRELHIGVIVDIRKSHGPYAEDHDVDICEVKVDTGMFQTVVTKEIALIPSFEEVEIILCEHCKEAHLDLDKCATSCFYCDNHEG